MANTVYPQLTPYGAPGRHTIDLEHDEFRIGSSRKSPPYRLPEICTLQFLAGEIGPATKCIANSKLRPSSALHVLGSEIGGELISRVCFNRYELADASILYSRAIKDD